MEILVISLRMALSAVFAFAAYGKILDPVGTEQNFTNAGFGSPASKILKYLLPAVELSVSIGLLLTATYLVSAILYAALVLGFTIYLGLKLRIGDQSDCHCFGQISTEPVGLSTILRNSVLLIVAVSVAVSASVIRPIELFPGGLETAYSIALIFVIHMTLIIVHLLAKNIRLKEELLEKLEGKERSLASDVSSPRESLPIGTLVNNLPFAVRKLSNPSLKRTMLVFLSPECVPCKTLASEMTGVENLFFVVKGEKSKSQAVFSGLPKERVFYDVADAFSERMKVKWTPTALVLDEHSRISARPFVGESQIRKLLNGFPIDFETNSSFRFLGKRIPSFEARDQNGKDLLIEKTASGLTMLIFWDEKCPFCVDLAKDLSQKEVASTDIIVVSNTPSFDFWKNSDVRFLELKDSDFPGSIGLVGTPTAVLIDQRSHIISEPAVGAKDILALLGV